MTERKYTIKQTYALANMTQKQAAKLLMVHVNTMRRYEKDPRWMSLGQATILATAAGISVGQIKT